MLTALSEIVGAAARDGSIRALILKSGVPGVFCSGGDLRFWAGQRDADLVYRSGHEVIERLRRMPMLTLAMIDGHVVGDGLSLALACDLRIASSAATFRLPEVALGFIPGWGAIRMLVDAVGSSRASEILLLGKAVDATEALHVGLVNAVVDPEELTARTMAIVDGTPALSRRATRAARCALRGGDERSCFASTWGSDDWAEGVASLLAKRAPVFSSNADGGCCE